MLLINHVVTTQNEILTTCLNICFPKTRKIHISVYASKKPTKLLQHCQVNNVVIMDDSHLPLRNCFSERSSLMNVHISSDILQSSQINFMCYFHYNIFHHCFSNIVQRWQSSQGSSWLLECGNMALLQQRCLLLLIWLYDVVKTFKSLMDE